MKNFALILMCVAVSLSAQQAAPGNPASQADQVGRVAGHVFCSDTAKPARFATIQLMSEQSAKAPLLTPAELGAAAGSGQDKGNASFSKLMAQGLSAMMKASSLSTMTAMDGSFSLDKIPAGTYYIIPQLPGYLSPIAQLSQKERMTADEAVISAVENASQKIEVQPGAIINIDIRLDRGAAIGGTVRYDDGSPAPAVTPVLMLLDKEGKWKDVPSSSLLPAATDDQGRYRFSGLPAGKYAVKAALPTSAASMGIGAASLALHMNTGDALVVYSGDAIWMKDAKPFELAAGDSRNDVDITFPVDGLHVVSGSVVAKSDGHPVNAGMVELQDPSDKTIKLRMAMIGKDGSFQFNYVPNGTYRLQVTSAADMEVEGAAAGDTSNPVAMLLSGKQPRYLKEYGEAGTILTLPGNSEGLTVQVSVAAGDKKP